MRKKFLVAPCGMNCGICYAYLREKNKCPGCRFFGSEEPKSIARCKMKHCDFFENEKVKFCFECQEFPCKELEHLDNRYKNKYAMSEVENLKYIKKNGIRKFIKKEERKWRCPKCGKIVCVHKKACLNCGKKYE